MLREHENIKEFKNGNILIRFPLEYKDRLLSGKISAVEVLNFLLEEIDCYFIGDSFCISNYDTGMLIYNCYSDLVYIIATSDILDVLANFRWLRLYARKPSDVDRKIIENEFGG
jgi:hypothetical protein